MTPAYKLYFDAAIEDLRARVPYNLTDEQLELNAHRLAERLKLAADAFIEEMGEE